jgi:predicted HAD superfamily phosphohydrolase
LPVLGISVGGVSGQTHGNDFVVDDWDIAVVDSAKVVAMQIIDLMYGDADGAKEVVDKARPEMTRDQYLAFQRQQAEEVDFDGAQE